MTRYLKCDADGCTHLETHDTITRDMVDKPCPKCGANLLTENDFLVFNDMWEIMSEFADLEFSEHKIGDPIPEGRVEVSVHYHDGITTITTRETQTEKEVSGE